MVLEEELIKILLCPRCKGNVHPNAAGDGIICDNCRLLYEIRDGIPIMLTDEAKRLEQDIDLGSKTDNP